MSREVINLSGSRWQMERIRPGQGEKEGLHLLPAEYQGTHFSWNFATIAMMFTVIYTAPMK